MSTGEGVQRGPSSRACRAQGHHPYQAWVPHLPYEKQGQCSSESFCGPFPKVLGPSLERDQEAGTWWEEGLAVGKLLFTQGPWKERKEESKAQASS